MSCCKRKRVDNEQEQSGVVDLQDAYDYADTAANNAVTTANSWFGVTDGYQYEKVVGITNPTLRQRFSRNVIEVHPLFENSSYKTSTIALAITAANALSPVPSASNPTTILLHPGIHYVADSQTLPTGVHIRGMGHLSSTISLSGLATQTWFFLMNDTCSITNCIIACNLLVAYCIVPNTSCNTLRLHDVYCSMWNSSFLRNIGSTAGCIATISNIDGLTLSATISPMIDSQFAMNQIKGTDISIQQGTMFIRGQSGTNIHISGATAKSCSSVVVSALGSPLGGTIVDNLTCILCVGVPCFQSTSAGYLQLNGVSMFGNGNSVQPLQQSADGGFISINGTNMTHNYAASTSVWNPARGSRVCNFTTDTVGTNGGTGFKVFGDMYMGHPSNPSSLTVGQGGKYPTPIFAADYNSSNSLLGDMSASCLAGTLHDMPRSGTNFYTVIGDQLDRFSGFVVNVSSVGSSTTPSDLVIEYYNGTTWVSIPYCVTNFVYPYHNHGTRLFPTGGYVHVTFDPSITYDSATSTWPLSGAGLGLTSRYYVRVRATVVIVAPARVLHLWVTRSDMKIDLRGNVSYTGRARTYKPLNIRYYELDPHGNPNLPTTTPLWFGTLVHGGSQYNTYAVGDIMGFCTFMPRDLDPSGPLVLNFAYISSSSTGGQSDFNVQVNYGHALSGDLINLTQTGTARDEQQVTAILTPNSSNGNNLVYTRMLLPINFLIPRAPTTLNNYDIFALQIARISGNAANSLIIVGITISYLSCMDGVSLFYQ